jgi:hypothetical protein
VAVPLGLGNAATDTMTAHSGRTVPSAQSPKNHAMGPI